MALKGEAKKAWRQRPEVRLRARELKAQHIARKRELGIPATLPLGSDKRAKAIAAREAGLREVEARRARMKAEAIARGPGLRSERNAKSRAYWQRIRALAIEALGGRCEWCGYDIALALEVDHIVPLRRRTTGNDDRRGQHYRAVVNGERGYQLLSSCCHTIKTRLVDPHVDSGQLELLDVEDVSSQLGLFDG